MKNLFDDPDVEYYLGFEPDMKTIQVVVKCDEKMDSSKFFDELQHFINQGRKAYAEGFPDEFSLRDDIQ